MPPKLFTQDLEGIFLFHFCLMTLFVAMKDTPMPRRGKILVGTTFMSSVAVRLRNISPSGTTSKTTNINTENALFKNSGINTEDAINRIFTNRARCGDRMGQCNDF